MTMSDDQSADTPIFDSRRDALEPELGEPGPALPEGGLDQTGQEVGSASATTTGYDAGGSQQSGSTVGAAKDEAGRVAGKAAQAGKDVAGTAKEQAQNVAGEAKNQVKDLYHQTTEELRTQAAQQQERVASGLRSVGEELDQMASASESGGVASDVVRQVAQRTQSIAGWLDARDPGSLLSEVKSYARRNPGTFIAAAAVAGVLAGRLTRALASGGDSGSGSASSTGTTGTTGYAGSTGYETTDSTYTTGYVAPGTNIGGTVIGDTEYPGGR
jgi:hypothetical protein